MAKSNLFIAPKSDTAEFERLPDGVYDSVCIGVVAKEFADFSDNTKTQQKLYFLFQITDNGATYYFKSKPCRPLIGERSNLFVMISGWSGATYERIAERFDATNMIGYGAQLVITSKPAKDGSGRVFAEVANILKPKKNVKTPVVQDAIPAYLVRGALEYELADGITVKPEISQAAVTQPAQAPTIQFQGKQGVEPSKTANANITQNADPAGWMGQQGFAAQQAQPTPPEQPAPAEGLDDPDGDLPF